MLTKINEKCESAITSYCSELTAVEQINNASVNHFYFFFLMATVKIRLLFCLLYSIILFLE